jgi:hypothetical protein
MSFLALKLRGEFLYEPILSVHTDTTYEGPKGFARS